MYFKLVVFSEPFHSTCLACCTQVDGVALAYPVSGAKDKPPVLHYIFVPLSYCREVLETWCKSVVYIILHNIVYLCVHVHKFF